MADFSEAVILDAEKNCPVYFPERVVHQWAGTVLHALIAAVTRRVMSGEQVEAIDAIAYREKAFQLLLFRGVSRERLDTLTDHVIQGLSRFLSSDWGQFILSGTSHLVEFGLVDPKTSRQYVIDCAFQAPSGSWVLVDYKSSLLPAGELEDAYLAAALDHYRPILCRYARLLMAYLGLGQLDVALYFPYLSSGWVKFTEKLGT